MAPSGLRIVRSFRVPPARGGQMANHDNAEIRHGKSEFSPAFLVDRFAGRSLIDEARDDGAAGAGARHAGTKMQRRAALERSVDRVSVDVARLVRRLAAGIGSARRGDDL